MLDLTMVSSSSSSSSLSCESPTSLVLCTPHSPNPYLLSPPSPKRRKTYLWRVPPAVPANLSCVSLISFILCIHPPPTPPPTKTYASFPKNTQDLPVASSSSSSSKPLLCFIDQLHPLYTPPPTPPPMKTYTSFPQNTRDLPVVSSSSSSSSLSCESPTSLVLCTPHSPNPYLLSPQPQKTQDLPVVSSSSSSSSLSCVSSISLVLCTTSLRRER